MASVVVVIVHYRTPDLLLACLASLGGEVAGHPDRSAVVVDNASADGSWGRVVAEVARRGYGWCRLVSHPANAGFAAGNNVGIRPLLSAENPPDYVHLLNPDTVVEPGAIRALHEFMEAHPKAGIAGSGLLHADGSPQCGAYRFHGILSEFERGIRFGPVTKLLGRWMVAPPPRNDAHPVDWVSGASFFVRRLVFEQVGLLSEEFFLYYEETDLCRRARKAGWEVWTLPASRVIHLEGASTGTTSLHASRKRMPRYWFDARRRYFRRNHGAAYEFLVNTGYAIAFALWRLRRRIQRKPDTDPPGFLGDFLRHAWWPYGRPSRGTGANPPTG